jgi:hypothetical protein
MQNSIKEKMFKGICRWQHSGLTQKAWCDKNKIAYGTFHYWYKRYRTSEKRVVGQDATEGFVQLMVDDTPKVGCWCELVFPNGRKLAFHQPVGADFLRSLIT